MTGILLKFSISKARLASACRDIGYFALNWSRAIQFGDRYEPYQEQPDGEDRGLESLIVY
jgi:hypothetical protein